MSVGTVEEAFDHLVGLFPCAIHTRYDTAIGQTVPVVVVHPATCHHDDEYVCTAYVERVTGGWRVLGSVHSETPRALTDTLAEFDQALPVLRQWVCKVRRGAA